MLNHIMVFAILCSLNVATKINILYDQCVQTIIYMAEMDNVYTVTIYDCTVAFQPLSV